MLTALLAGISCPEGYKTDKTIQAVIKETERKLYSFEF